MDSETEALASEALAARSGDAPHRLTWLLHLWCSSGGSVLDATRDRGWFHEAIHLLDGISDRKAEDVVELVRAVEESVPGLLLRSAS